MTRQAGQGHRRGDEGAVLVWVACFLMAALWCVALAVDIGKVMAAKTELQAAADAAALAGASAIDPDTGEIVQDSARVRAAAVAFKNEAYEGVTTPIVIDPAADVDFPTPNRVRVTVRREDATGNPVLLHFAQTVGIPTLDVRARATAEAQQLTDICEGLAPFAPTQPPNGIPFSSDCDSTYLLKVGAQENEQGNFQLLDYPDCNEDGYTPGGGADAVHYYTVNGYDCCVGIGDEIETQPGNEVGPVRDALRDRWDADTDTVSDCYQTYTGNGSRVFNTPIIETFDVNGKKMVRILGFAAFFLRERPQGSMSQQGVAGQFIKMIAPGNAGDDPPVDTGIYGVHLVE
jgi:Flp pilus assembly protein TadG